MRVGWGFTPRRLLSPLSSLPEVPCVAEIDYTLKAKVSNGKAETVVVVEVSLLSLKRSSLRRPGNMSASRLAHGAAWRAERRSPRLGAVFGRPLD